MPLKLIRQDITKMRCDAIVNPTDPHYSHGGGIDAMIHEAAGVELYHFCREKGLLQTGKAIISPGFALPCRYVIHTVGPIWQGRDGEEELLRSCYREALSLALENKCKSVAFPLISSGAFGFPKDRVLKIAMDVLGDFLFEHEMLIYLVVFDKTAYSISEKLFCDVTEFIDDAYADCMPPLYDSMRERRVFCEYEKRVKAALCADECCEEIRQQIDVSCGDTPPKSLEEMLKQLDKGFAQTLFEYIDAKGMTDVECYKRANVDKKTFSKIRSNKNYKPSKVTAVSFAIALRLDLEQTNRLLNTVGMSLSRSSVFDVIIEYFITTGNYGSIFDVNETLYQFDQVTLGV